MKPMITGTESASSGTTRLLMLDSLAGRARASPWFAVVMIPASAPSRTTEGIPRWRRAALTIGAESRSPKDMM